MRPPLDEEALPMRMNAVIAKYETLKSKDREKAQEYLRDQAYLKHPDERELDQLYRSEFSRPRAPDRARSDALRQLRSKKNVDLSKAADKVCSAALASWSRQR